MKDDLESGSLCVLDDYEKAPDSVNPSLWENTINNHAYGLFEVTDGIYQVRGYDMANLTVVKGDTRLDRL